MEVFRRNAQPHIADMRKGGAWGYVPNKQICVWGPRRIACHYFSSKFSLIGFALLQAEQTYSVLSNISPHPRCTFFLILPDYYYMPQVVK